MTADTGEDLVVIARISKPRGLKGEVVADVLTDFPERFDDTHEVVVRTADGQRPSSIERFFFQKGRVVLKLAGFDSVEAAETLRNADVCVPESETVPAGDDEFYDWQLTGCTVKLPDGTPLGNVTELMRTGGTELLVVAGEKEYLIPFAAAICTTVDIENKVIEIDPPDGLLDL